MKVALLQNREVASYKITIFLVYFLVSSVVKQLSPPVTLCFHQIPGIFVEGLSCRALCTCDWSLWCLNCRREHSLILDLGFRVLSCVLDCSLLEYVNGGDLMFHMQRQRKLPEACQVSFVFIVSLCWILVGVVLGLLYVRWLKTVDKSFILIPTNSL